MVIAWRFSLTTRPLGNYVVMATPRDPGVIVNYRFPRDLHARAKQLAAWKGQTLRVWLTRAVETVVEAQEAERSENERQRRSR
jgi:hypothetical protein